MNITTLKPSPDQRHEQMTSDIAAAVAPRYDAVLGA
jgi:hypothetical protein